MAETGFINGIYLFCMGIIRDFGRFRKCKRYHRIYYAQSGVFTPCDFAFPTDGKRAEATPNTEMILVSDVDLDLLNELHTYGSVRNLKDRRNDLYEVRYKK